MRGFTTYIFCEKHGWTIIQPYESKPFGCEICGEQRTEDGIYSFTSKANVKQFMDKRKTRIIKECWQRRIQKIYKLVGPALEAFFRSYFKIYYKKIG